MRSLIVGITLLALLSPPRAQAIGREPMIIGASAVSLVLVGLLAYKAVGEENSKTETASYDVNRRDFQSVLRSKLEDLNPDGGARRFLGDTSQSALDKGLARYDGATGFSASLLTKLKEDRARREALRFVEPSVSLGASVSQSPARLVPMTAFQTNPLLDNREGQLVNDGGNAWFAPRARGDLFEGFSYEIEPIGVANSHGANDTRVYFRRAYGKATFGQLEVKAGLSPVQFGMGRYSNLGFSANAEPLPTVRLSNAEPLTFPSFLEGLGPTRFELFVARLDADREFPNPWLEGLQLDFLPTPRFEVGFYLTFQFGGSGTNGNFLSPFGKDLTGAPSNRNFGMNFRYRVPGIELEPYLELHAEDCCGPNYFAWNTRDILSLCGLYFPKLDAEGKWDLAVEWARTNFITYRHDVYLSGYKFKKQGLGHVIGSDGDGFYGILRYFASAETLSQLTLAYELRRPPGATAAQERRYRIQSQLTQDLTPRIHLSTEVGYEHAQDFGFTAGQTKSNYFAGFSIAAE